MSGRRLLVSAILICFSSLACSQATFVKPAYETRAGTMAGGGWLHAKSLILFIGDGMGPEIVSIAKVYSEKALEKPLNMVEFANTGRAGLASTYSNNRLVTDSAAGATALSTGTKTNNGKVGTAPDGAELKNLLERAVSKGKSVGVITTTTITDATPASFLSHVAIRANEVDIAAQIVEGDATVVMGGGKAYFLPSDGGKRTDGRDLVAEAKAKGFDVVFDKAGLDAFAGKRLIGLFADEDMPYDGERRAYETPSLTEMFDKALRTLTADPDGFVLVVEGGRIDHAEHENLLGTALGELLALDAALSHAMEYQQSDSTLTIVVTADHDTGAPALTSTNAGYPSIDDVANITGEDYGYLKWISEGHTGTMVPIFARGPGQDLFAGIKDNTDTNRAMVMVLGL
jgi:alkaline phosphatase